MSYRAPSFILIGFSIDRKTADRGADKERLPRLKHIAKNKWEIPLLFLYSSIETQWFSKPRVSARSHFMAAWVL